MTALRRLMRILRAEPEPRPPYKPRHARPEYDLDMTQPFPVILGDPQ